MNLERAYDTIDEDCMLQIKDCMKWEGNCWKQCTVFMQLVYRACVRLEVNLRKIECNVSGV